MISRALFNYSPNTAIEPFRLTGFSSMEGRGSGAGAGEGFTTHTADFERYFTVRSAEKVRLMVAVSEDLERALIASGAEITSKSGDAVGGYHFEYVAGQTKGSVTISPLGPGKTMRRMPLPAGSEDIALMIDMKEKWFVQPGKVSKAQ